MDPASLPPPGPLGHHDSACGLAEQGGQILLVRNERVFQGQTRTSWDLPGGRVREGESASAAASREFEEETGLPGVAGDLVLVEDGVKRSAADAPVLMTWRTFFFEMACEGTPTPGEGILEAVWIARDEAPGLLTAPYHAPMRAYLAGDRRRHATVEWIDDRSPIDDGLGDVRLLAMLAAGGALGDARLAAGLARIARAAGVSSARVEETLLQLAPYCGFPRTLAALAAAAGALDAPRELGGHEAPRASWGASGARCFDAVYGTRADRIRAGLVDTHPLVQRWIEEFAYGRVKSRDAHVTLRERELLAVAILAAMGRLDGPLRGHMRAALELGAPREHVEAVLAAIPFHAGEHRIARAFALLRDLP